VVAGLGHENDFAQPSWDSVAIAQNNYAMCSVHMHGYHINTRLFWIQIEKMGNYKITINTYYYICIVQDYIYIYSKYPMNRSIPKTRTGSGHGKGTMMATSSPKHQQRHSFASSSSSWCALSLLLSPPSSRNPPCSQATLLINRTNQQDMNPTLPKFKAV
jgi:hypothetical protein